MKTAIAGQVAPDSCADCHQPGLGEKYMKVKSFATMCSGCHNGDISGATQVSGPKGIDVIAVPGLDVATLSGHGIDIGFWPRGIRGSCDAVHAAASGVEWRKRGVRRGWT